MVLVVHLTNNKKFDNKIFFFDKNIKKKCQLLKLYVKKTHENTMKVV